MKFNFIQTIISIAISILISYSLYSIHEGENKILLSIGSFLFLSTSLMTMIGINFEQSRTTTNIRFVSGIFFVLAFISNLVFSFFTFSIPSYIIINGILLLIFVLIVYSIYKAKQ